VRTQFRRAADGSDAMLGRTRAVDAACGSSSRPSRYSRAVVPSKTAAIEYQRPGSSAPPPRSTDRGPTTNDGVPSINSHPARPALRVAQRGDDRFAWLNALDAQPARHRPRAPQRNGAASSANGRVRPTPPSRKAALYATEIRGRGNSQYHRRGVQRRGSHQRGSRAASPASDRKKLLRMRCSGANP